MIKQKCDTVSFWHRKNRKHNNFGTLSGKKKKHDSSVVFHYYEKNMDTSKAKHQAPFDLLHLTKKPEIYEKEFIYCRRTKQSNLKELAQVHAFRKTSTQSKIPYNQRYQFTNDGLFASKIVKRADLALYSQTGVMMNA